MNKQMNADFSERQLGGVGRSPEGSLDKGEGTVPFQHLSPPEASSLGISDMMGGLGKTPSLDKLLFSPFSAPPLGRSGGMCTECGVIARFKP